MNRIDSIDKVKFFLLLCVVAIHTPLVDFQQTSNPIDFCCYYIIKIIHIIFSIVNPSFFVISGYLFFNNITSTCGKWNWSAFWGKIRRRINSLVIPYFIWNLIPLFFGLFIFLYNCNIEQNNLIDILRSYFQGKGPRIFWHFIEWGGGTNILGFPISPNSGPINVPLYFIRDIFILCLLSPIIYAGIRYLRSLFFLIIFFCFITGIWPNITGLRIVGMFYFSLGSLIALRGIAIDKVINYKKVLQNSVLFIVLFCLLFFNFGILTSVLYIVFSLLSLSFLLRLFSKKSNFHISGFNGRIISQSAFFIYAAHEGLYFLNICIDFISIHINVVNNSTSLLTFTFIFIGTICLCLMTYFIVYYLLGPKIKYLTGVR